MTFDPMAAGFRWPTQQTLTRGDGAQLNIAPSAVNFAGIAKGGRQAECYRYYSTSYGLLTELEVTTWFAGGQWECFDLLSAYNNLFSGSSEMPFAEIVTALQARGFADQTILVNLTWLLEDGYAELETKAGVPYIRKIKT